MERVVRLSFTALLAASLVSRASCAAGHSAAAFSTAVLPARLPSAGSAPRRLIAPKMVVLELYYKQAQLLDSLVPTVIMPMHQRLQHAGGGLSRVLLTYKGPESAATNPQDAAALRRVLPPEIEVSCVWSAKNADVGSGKNARGAHATKEEATFAQFQGYNKALAASCASLLVVSGTGKKKALDSVQTLARAAASPSGGWLPLGVAYNPHIGGALDPASGAVAREEEWARLQQKLRTGCVSEVWVSFGADVPALRTGLARLRTELAAANGGAAVRVLGSVFVPSKAWLAKMRFRCWVGTFLGAKAAPGGYLSGPDAAAAVTRETLAALAEFGVEPVIESSVCAPPLPTVAPNFVPTVRPLPEAPPSPCRLLQSRAPPPCRVQLSRPPPLPSALARRRQRAHAAAAGSHGAGGGGGAGDAAGGGRRGVQWGHG